MPVAILESTHLLTSVQSGIQYCPCIPLGGGGVPNLSITIFRELIEVRRSQDTGNWLACWAN